MKNIVRQIPDHWRDNCRCYASHWGFRCGSKIAKLIEYIRDEHRAKYGTDYRLRRLGKNRFLAVPGDFSSFGVSYAVVASQKFNTSVVCESQERYMAIGKDKNETTTCN